jgi:predicted nucleotidyltransferase
MAVLFSSAEFAHARGLSEQRVRQLLAAGKVAGALRVGARWAIPADAPIRRTQAGRPPQRRASVLKQAARACDAALAMAGVRALVVGSLAYGAVRPESDLDLLIVSYPGKKWSEVSSIAAAAARPYGVRVDVIFADTVPPAVRRVMLKDARRAGAPVRENLERLIRAVRAFQTECKAFAANLPPPRRARRKS